MINSKKNVGIILIAIIAVGIFIRFYKLGEVPKGFYIDEASIGYNAYSILKTGKDEFGKSFPVMFRSFSTFQSPIYTYITVPFVYFLGITPFSVRLPSAIFGMLTIPLLFFLVKNLSPEPNNKYLAPFSATLLAISPWHILYSRTAYEANIALFLLLLGLLLLYSSLKKAWFLLLSAVTLSLSALAYRAEIFLVPVLLTMFIVLNFKKFLEYKKQFFLPAILSFVIGIIIIFPTLKIIKTPGFKARTSALSILSNVHEFPWGKVNGNGPLASISNNRTILTIREFSSLYSSYFSPRFIFSLGDAGPRKPFPDLGSLFVWQFPFYLVGLYYLLKSSDQKKLKPLILTLLLASPIPASLTRDPYSTLRSLPMVIPLAIIVSYGIIKSWDLVSISYYVKLLLLTLIVFYSLGKMYVSIFYHHDYYRSEFWSYGWQEAVDTIDKLNPKIPILVDSVRGHPYIELLFFSKFDPEKYQNENFEVSSSDYYSNISRNETKKIGRVTVKNFVWGVDTDRVEKYLIVDSRAISDQQILEHNITKIIDILYPNKEIALRILKTNPSQ